MCGLLSFSFKKDSISHGRRALLAQALAIKNDDRGGHSWGVYSLMGGNKYKIRRGLGDLADHSYELLDHHVMMAHTRWKTTGDVKVQNAHPFTIGNIIGAHNGMITNHEELNKKYNRNFEVDSMHIFAHLDSGLDIAELKGYGSILWVNKSDPNTINACKMSGGSLAIAGIGKYSDPIGAVVSSTEDHLVEALKSAGIKKYFLYRVDVGQVYTIANGFVGVNKKKLNLCKEEKNANVLYYNSSQKDDDLSDSDQEYLEWLRNEKYDYANEFDTPDTNFHRWQRSRVDTNKVDPTDMKDWNNFCERNPIGGNK